MTDKLAILIKRLEAATNSGTVDWKKDPKLRTFVVSFPNYSVALTLVDVTEEFGGTREDVQVLIYNELGEVVEKAYSWELESMGLSRATNVLLKLYESARRKAMGVDAALDSILAELPSVRDEDVPF